MNMQADIKMTAAETALVDAYGSQLGDLPGDGAVLSMRDGLLYDLKTEGLPTRRLEAWHYTDLRALLRAIPAVNPASVAGKVDPLVRGSLVLPVLNGQAETREADGITVKAFRENLTDGSAAVALGARGKDDAIGRINGSFVRDGLSVAFADGLQLEVPVELQAVQGSGQYHTRFPVTFGTGVKATVIERHLSVSADASLVSAVSDLVIGDDADITWVIIQQQGPVDTHLGQIKMTIGARSNVKLFVLNAGGKLVRQEIHIAVKGEGSDLRLRGINLLGGETHTDVTFTLEHEVPHTTSTEIIRNVVLDKAKGVFQGKIRVAPDAQKTDAKMSCNTLLLSDDADFSAKPELEIFADDVQCGHGATVIDINDTHLFYLMARGIPENVARGMLVNAFVDEIVEELENESLIESLETIVSIWLEKYA